MLFETIFDEVDWPPPILGEERASEPGFILAGEPVVGFAHVLEVSDRWHLEQIVVDPVHGRRGLGAALLDGVCREVASRGGRQVTLRTFADLQWNAPFHERDGFVELDPSRTGWCRFVRRRGGWA